LSTRTPNSAPQADAREAVHFGQPSQSRARLAANVRHHSNMSGGSWLRAVALVLLVDFLISLAQAFYAESEFSWVDGAHYLVSFALLPFWAGVRVRRAGGNLRSCALGGLSLLLSAAVSIPIYELVQPLPPGTPWPDAFLGILVLFPLLVLFGSLGGFVAKSFEHRES